MRRFLNKRNLLIATGVLLLALISAVLGLYVFINSPAFNERVRNFIVEQTGTYTGAAVSLGDIRWSLRDQRLVLQDLTLRGTEPAAEAPLAHFESITAGVNLRSLLQRRVDLFELTIVNPEFHLIVDPQGRTNLPGPVKREGAPETQLSLSIDNFKITGGRGLINERQTRLDLAVTNLKSDLRYRSDTQVLSAQVSYNGTLARPGETPIAYELSSDFDLTKGTIIAPKIQLKSERGTIALQGRIDKIFTADTAGKLAYTGNFQSAFLKYFLTKDTFGGKATARGELEFARGTLSTTGDMTSERLELNGWTTGEVKAKYSYRYPEKQLMITRLSAKALEGVTTGNIVIDSLPGQPHVTLDVDYADIDAAKLTRAYPWDPKYRIYSRTDGKLKGWFTGRFAQFEFEGDARLSAYTPPNESGVVALPATGTVSFALRPGEADIRSSDVRFFETAVQAQGRIQRGQLDLTANMASSDLANLYFLYANANGKGTFNGTIKGPFEKPTAEGVVVLNGHKHQEWTIDHAEGHAKLDMQTELADLKDMQVTIGQSTATVNGTARIDGSVVNLRIHSEHARAEDFQNIAKERIGGLLSGDVLVTSLQPLKVEGHVKGSGLSARGRTFEAFEGDITYNEPSVEIRNMTVSEAGARLTGGNIRYDTATGVFRGDADVSSVSLDQIRELGVPDTLTGTLQRAHIEVGGTQDRPQIEGTATFENLSFRGETFPRARLTLSTTWPYLNVTVSETRNVSLDARVDLSAANYPFEASAKFQDYSIEKLAKFSQGTLTASGEANLKGQLKGEAQLSGNGVIRALRAEIRQYPFTTSKPFAFSFDTSKVTLSEEASFNGAYGTRVGLRGSIGLTDSPALDLRVRGNLDLSEITAVNQSLSVTGLVTLDARVGGTPGDPNISGIANISNGSLGREGIYTTVSMLNGDIRFNENRVTFDNLVGQVGGGTVRIRGTSLIQNSQLEGLNVQFDVDQVRLRYPEGLRSVVTGTLLLRGTSTTPLLDGNLRLDSMSYRSSFEPFLALFQPGGLDSGGTMFDRVQLSVHVAGNRSISIQNELTNVTSARVDLDVKGTIRSPSLTGHVEASEGSLTFQGKRYEITRGNIDFVDPLKIDPVVDIQAETDLRDYRVILAISGRGDRIHVDLRSDPPLSQLELVSLIGGGKTQEELEQEAQQRAPSGGKLESPVPTSEELFQGGAASILADLLRSKVGSRFGLMGLDWIRFNPHFESAASNPSLRVTLTQQVSKDLSVTYSQDLSSNQQRLIMIEYFVARNLSIVASREESNDTSALGLDIKIRKRF